MRKLITQIVVCSALALALVGLGSVSSMLAYRPIAPVAPDTAASMVKAQLADARLELERANQIIRYSSEYSIPADLATKIYDIAIEEGVPPAVGFRLVKVESGFQPGAQSTASAIGLTQLRLPTARAYDATVDASDLMNSNVSLRLGFRYLRDLLDRFDNDMALALEAYNKGPTFVSAEQDQGNDVEGRYSRSVLSGRRGQ